MKTTYIKGISIINPDEVEELEWIDIENLTIDLIKKPQIFAPWFLLAAPKVIEYLNHPNNCFLKQLKHALKTFCP